MATENHHKTRVRVIGISGSLSEGSQTSKAVALALRGAEEEGAETQFIDLREYHLVFYGMVKEDEYPEDVFRLRREVKSAHGIILGTPEYHAGLSGVLKNALDLMGFDEFEGKMMGLIGVSGGSLGAVNALSSLRDIGRSLHAWVLPQQVAIPEAYKHFDKNGEVTEPDLHERLLNIGRQVATFAKLHEMQKDQQFIRLWEGLPVNPGGQK